MAGCDYANARLGAMRGRLLGAKGILELVVQPDLAARIGYLQKTPGYGQEVSAHVARGPDSLRGAERGLHARLSEDLLRIERFLRGEHVRSLFHAVLAFEDGWSLKTVLRGITKGEPPERILALVVPTPLLDEPALEQLVRQKQVKGVVDLLATWRSLYARPLVDAFDRYAAHADLFVLEVPLDRFLFARALGAARGDGADGRILLGFLETQIDLANAGVLLKLAGSGRAEEFFVPGGRALTGKRFRRLAGLGERELREALARERGLHCGARLASTAERGEPFAVDQVLHDALRDVLRRTARLHPLSLAVPLSYALELRAEIRQVRLVLRGAEFGLPADELLAAVGG